MSAISSFVRPTEEVQRALLGERVLGVVEGLEVKLEQSRLAVTKSSNIGQRFLTINRRENTVLCVVVQAGSRGPLGAEGLEHVVHRLQRKEIFATSNLFLTQPGANFINLTL